MTALGKRLLHGDAETLVKSCSVLGPDHVLVLLRKLDNEEFSPKPAHGRRRERVSPDERLRQFFVEREELMALVADDERCGPGECKQPCCAFNDPMEAREMEEQEYLEEIFRLISPGSMN